VNKGHGRLERRRIWASSDLRGYLDFPHAEQVFVIEREVRDLDGTLQHCELAYGVTSLATAEATPVRLLDLNRGHWQIENGLHWVRDVTFGEDLSRIRRGAGAQGMATLRNLAIGLLRREGVKNIARARRACAWEPGRVLELMRA